MLSQPQGPLPDPQFVVDNLPIERPAALTTCTKKGKAATAAAKSKRKMANTEGATTSKKGATTRPKKKAATSGKN
jgi:hypothetical protein